MKTLCKRLVSMLLVFVLVLGLMPSVYAATDDGTSPTTEPTVAETTVPTETVAEETTQLTETTEATETSEPTDTTEPSTQPTEGEQQEEPQPTEAAKPSKGPLMMAANNDGIMLAASTQSNIMLFDFADNGNYTTVLNSQLAVSYKPNGSGTTRTAYIKNLGWHFARYGNVPYADDPLYCIEPWRNYGASTSGNSVDRDVTLSGSSSTTGGSVWYSMPEARRKAIGLILLYSNEMWDHSISVTTTRKDSNPNVPLRIATQFLIYEIVCGLRDPDTFQLKSSNECGTEGDIFYNAGVDAVSYFAPNYNNLVSYVQAALEIPSFTSSSSSTAPVIQMNSEEISVYDSNGVLSDFSFTDKGGVEFYKSGNTLYITQTGTISESTVHTATKYIPSAENSTYCLWYMSNSSYQTTISLYSPESGSLNAYFKVKGPAVGNLSLTKSTEDGLNLSGWRFGIYSNSACTSLVSGPHTTGSTGKINISGLAAGTYYVKELGHSDSTINSKYVCSSTNPQKVTISAGSTASVSFVNQLNQGNLSLTKTTDDNQNLSGWQFSIYSDAACSKLVSGPYTTNSSGKISVTGLTPGTYYVKEVGHTSSSIYSQYVCSSTNPQKVTITYGQTASVSFVNKLNQGNLALTKVTDDNKNLSGWQFGIYTDYACNNLVSGLHTTDANGKISVTGLTPGSYYVKEIGHSNSNINSQYACSSTNPQQVTIGIGSTASVSFTNKVKTGNFSLVKTTGDNQNLAGWKFGIYSDASCNTLVSGPHTTGTGGRISVTGLKIGTYYVKEIGHTEPSVEAQYVCTTENPQKVTITYGGTASVSFHNDLIPGAVRIVKETNTNSNLAGWKFNVYTNSGCTNLLTGSPFTTGADGVIVTEVEAGTYYVKEVDESSTKPDWTFDTSVKTVVVPAGGTGTVTFTNTHYGYGRIVKKTNTGANLGGWQFNLYTDAGCTKVVSGSPFTSAQDGSVQVRLLPGTYYAREVNVSSGKPDWDLDLEVRKLTVEAGKTTSVNFTNIHYGYAKIIKETSTGTDLAGWKFNIFADETCTTLVAGSPFVSAEDGTIAVRIEPGTYYVQEIDESAQKPDWAFDTTVREVKVEAGKTASVTIVNTRGGYLEIQKKTNVDGTLGGWKFNIYTDKACTKLVTGSPFTSDESGKITAKLEPGTYYVREIDESADKPFWQFDDSTQEVTVQTGKTVTVTFENVQQGRLKLIKTMPDGGNVAGWEFDVYLASDNTHIGTYTSGEDGTIFSDYLMPGEYLVSEKIDEASIYWCETENPQKVTVKTGETAEVTFTNRLKPGKIAIHKVDMTGEPLAGAEFLLEWSADGNSWMPVVRTDSQYVKEGTCNNPEINNGKLISDETGLVEFTGLHPDRYYRLTETKAPEGFLLLSETAFEGKLPADNELTVELTVVNVRTFQLPETGSKSFVMMSVSLALACGLCAVMLYHGRRKED